MVVVVVAVVVLRFSGHWQWCVRPFWRFCKGAAAVLLIRWWPFVVDESDDLGKLFCNHAMDISDIVAWISSGK